MTVYGWVTGSDGIPLGNAPVRILAAPDNGSGAWHTAAVVTTSADGSWQATLHPGPSRLVQATYAGGPDTEAASSAVVKVILPAKVVLTDVTRSVSWGGVLVIRGRLLGGTQIAVTTLKETDYPYVRGSSPRVWVTIG